MSLQMGIDCVNCVDITAPPLGPLDTALPCAAAPGARGRGPGAGRGATVRSGKKLGRQVRRVFRVAPPSLPPYSALNPPVVPRIARTCAKVVGHKVSLVCLQINFPPD